MQEILENHVKNGGILPDCIAVMEQYFIKIDWIEECSEYRLKKYQDGPQFKDEISLTCPLQGFLFCLLNTALKVNSELFSRFAFVNMVVADEFKIPRITHG